MYFFNITASLDYRHAKMWLEQVEQQFIPGMLALEVFDSCTVLKLMGKMDESTYTLQFGFTRIHLFDRFRKEHQEEKMEELWALAQGETGYFTSVVKIHSDYRSTSYSEN